LLPACSFFPLFFSFVCSFYPYSVISLPASSFYAFSLVLLFASSAAFVFFSSL
jgi:hypothetical protein